MNKIKVIRSFLVLLISFIVVLPLSAKPFVLKKQEAVVMEVVDGDTIRVRTKDRDLSVRMLYIDTMEKSYNAKMKKDIYKFSEQGILVNKKDLIALGKLATIYLKSVLKEKDTVVLETVKGNEKDRYGRTLAVVYRKAVNANLLMVRNGYARVYFFGKVPDVVKNEYLAAERKAVSERLTIWNYIKKTY